jgi:chemotaxis protein CheD
MTRARVDVFLTPGKLAASTDALCIKTIVGSCVAVCLWDRLRKAGGVNHYLLPVPGPGDASDERFGSVAILRLVDRLAGLGCRRRDLLAAVVGGGHPVSTLKSATVGDDNVNVGLTLLRQLDIRVTRQETGGAHGRKLLFNTATGQLRVRSLRGWDPVSKETAT